MRRLFSDFVRRKNTFQTHILDPKALLGGSTEMPDFFDRNDTRPAKSREASLFRNLKTIVAIAKPRASGLRRLLRDCETPTIAQRADLARLPVMRKRDMERMRAEDPPFGGMLATRLGARRRVVLGAPQGQSRDWWNSARALAAAGFEKGDVILNCFSYHLAADGHIIEDGALALGCAVIPAGTARIERKLEAIHALTPNAFCGEPEHLKQLLDQARDLNRDVSSLRKALVFGQHLSPHVRADIEARGIGIHQAFVTADLGVIAYETDLPDGSLNEGMIVSEGLILEIVKPGTNEPARAGEVGEVVVTRVIPDFPLLRMSTGDLSRIIPGPSPCGRTSPRIAGWLGRVDETTRVGDLTLTPSQVLDLGARHACVRRLQLVVSAEDATTLKAEGPAEDVDLPANLKRNMLAISGVDCKIEIVAPGVLTDKSRLVVDERR
jgi:phenylacetate-CoA ligase